MRVDFINDHDSWLLSQIRRIAIVLGVTHEHIRQPLQDGLCPLAKDIKGDIPVEGAKLWKQAVLVCGNAPELDGEAFEYLRGDGGYLGQEPAHGWIIAAPGTVGKLDHLLQDRCVADE